MALTQKQWKLVFGVVIGCGVTLIIAGVITFLVILLTGEDYCDKPSSLPTFLYVSENNGDVRVQWSRSIYTCSGSYLLQYSLNGGQQIEVSTTDLEHIVTKPPVCAHMLIQLRTVGESGRISEESFDRDYTVLSLFTYVTNPEITRTDTGIVASWEKPTELEACDVSYIVRFTTETQQFNEHSSSPSITVPEDIFCFYVRVQVASIIGFSETFLTDVGYVNAPRIPIDFTVSPENPFQLIATWSHHNEDMCSLRYEVTYRIGSKSETFLILQPKITVDIQYCVYATLTILPIAYDGEITGWSSLFGVTQFPDNIAFEPIENVTFALSEESMTVSWDIPDGLSQCEYLYEVTARNSDLNEEASCHGSNGCEVTLTSYCPSTDFIITPIGLQGETVSETYSCTRT